MGLLPLTLEGGEPVHAPSRSPVVTDWAAQAGNRHLVLLRRELKGSTEEGALCLSAAVVTREKTRHLARLKEAMGARSQASWGGATRPWVTHGARVFISHLCVMSEWDTPISLPVE